jgi:hypothetical protein
MDKILDQIKIILQILITLVISVGYVVLVFRGKAQVEGFVLLAMYVIKKLLDIVELQNGGAK